MTRVLVAEDEHFVREALTRILNGMDCEVIQARAGTKLSLLRWRAENARATVVIIHGLKDYAAQVEKLYAG